MSEITDRSSVRLGFIDLGNIPHHHAKQIQTAGLPGVVAAAMDVDADARRQFADAYDAVANDDHEDVFGDVDAYTLELERFLDAVVAGEPTTLNTVEQAVTVQQVIDGIYRSSEANGPARLD